MNMANFIVGGLLVLIVALAIRKIHRDKKQGKTCCGSSGCKACSKCHQNPK